MGKQGEVRVMLPSRQGQGGVSKARGSRSPREAWHQNATFLVLLACQLDSYVLATIHLRDTYGSSYQESERFHTT